MTFVNMAKAGAALAGALWVAQVQAAGVGVPYTFTSGTPARASEVNADFQALATAINSTNSAVAGITGSSATFASDVTVNGNLTVGGQADLRVTNTTSPAPAAAGNTGKLYLDTNSGTLKYSNGSAWRPANAGNYTYNTASGMQYVQNSCSEVTFHSRDLTFVKQESASKIRYTYMDTLYASNSGGAAATVIIYMDGTAINQQMVQQAAGPFYATIAMGGYVSIGVGTHSFAVSILPGIGCSAPMSTYELGQVTNFMFDLQEVN